MSMVSVGFDVPQEILLDLKVTEKAFTDYARKYLALDLYKNKHISLGYCTELADMNEEDFIKFLGDNSVSIFGFEDEDDFLEELNNA
jgi:predicted HTH domain antitoxin